MKRSLNSTLKPILWYSTRLLFSPCDFDGRIVKCRLPFSIAVSCSIFVVLLIYLKNEICGPPATTNLQHLSKWRKILRMVTCIVNIVCQNYWLIFHPTAFESILRRLRVITKMCGSSVEFSRINWFIGLISLSVLYSIQIATFVYSPDQFLKNFCSYFIPQTYSMVIIVQVTALLEILCCLFQKLNEKALISKKLNEAAEIHSALCKVAVDVNRLYSVQLLFLISESLMYMTTQCYQLFKVITGPATLEGIKAGLPLYLLGRITLIWGMCHLSTELSHECESFYQQLVSSMRNQCYPCFDQTLSLYIAYRRTVVISAAGIFTVSNHIITSIIATGATYFIVLIQIE